MQRGEAWCTSARRPHADVWRKVWHCIKDLGESAVCVVKCKSHISASRRAALGEEDQAIADGNDLADEAAKRGADWEEAERYRGEAVREASERVTGVLTCIAEVLVAAEAGGGLRDAAPLPPRKGDRWADPPPQPPRPAGQARRASLAARLYEAADQTVPPRGRVGAIVRGHRLGWAAPYFWCLACGARAASRLVGLARPCAGRPADAKRAGAVRRALRAAAPAPLSISGLEERAAGRE